MVGFLAATAFAPMSFLFVRRVSACLLALTPLLLAGCGPSGAGDAARPGAAPASAPPVAVTTVPARTRDMSVLLTATGTVTPLSSVEVRPQVTSVIRQVHVCEGQVVRQGELLFTLDSRADEANLAKAQAQLTRDQAALADAQRQLARSRELLAQQFVSQSAVDTAQVQVDSQQAAVAADRAAIDAARVPVAYARIQAPGAGRIGAISVYPGSSVQANVTTLVTLTQLAPIAVAFNLPQRHLADALAALPGGGAAVQATLPDRGETLTGRLQFVDNAVDPASGTVKVKALFDNRRGQLWPGAFVNVAMQARTLAGAVVVPQASIIQSARGPIVYVVQEGKAVLRPVQVLHAQGEDAAVQGVQPGDAVVLDGRQNLRPGAAVTLREPAAAAATADGARRPRGPASSASAASAP
jgi:RND family efflux transporter MFP subunit